MTRRKGDVHTLPPSRGGPLMQAAGSPLRWGRHPQVAVARKSVEWFDKGAKPVVSLFGAGCVRRCRNPAGDSGAAHIQSDDEGGPSGSRGCRPAGWHTVRV